MTIRKTIKTMGAFTLAAVMLISVSVFSHANPNRETSQTNKGMWITGDFHTHTNISDGSYRADQVAAKAVQYGLDWYAATDHGGIWPRNDAGETVGNRFRWETLLGEASDKVDQNRRSILQYYGFELNAPGHEHASVGIIGDNTAARKGLALFEYLFDFSDTSEYNDLNSEMKAIVDASGISKNTINNHKKSVEAAQWLQKNHPKTGYFLPNHPTRMLAGSGSGWLIQEIRELHDTAPDVFFGMEMMPGHQKSPFRGGLARFYYNDSKQNKIIRLSAGSANTIEEMVDNYISANSALPTPLNIDSKTDILKSLNESIPRLRTYGGVDFYGSKIGGVWDALLSEGRRFWIFGNSDFHTNESGPGAEPDFWPGEYSKLYTNVEDKTYQGILDGMRSGNTYSVLGDLINYLDYTITVGRNSATMGQTVSGAANTAPVVIISFKSPDKNHANTDGRSSINEKPVVHHIDLIAGEVTGKAPNYTVDSVTTTMVIATFTAKDWEVDKNGICHISFKLPTTDKNMYYRLRGTNLAPNTIGLTDQNGNPLVDIPFNSAKGTNTPEANFIDLWFYSNPIFVSAR
jgi:hypothetical protein